MCLYAITLICEIQLKCLKPYSRTRHKIDARRHSKSERIPRVATLRGVARPPPPRSPPAPAVTFELAIVFRSERSSRLLRFHLHREGERLRHEQTGGHCRSCYVRNSAPATSVHMYVAMVVFPMFRCRRFVGVCTDSSTFCRRCCDARPPRAICILYTNFFFACWAHISRLWVGFRCAITRIEIFV